MTTMLCPKCFENDEWCYYDENIGRLKLKPNAPEEIQKSYEEFYKEYAEANNEDLAVDFSKFDKDQIKLLKKIHPDYKSKNIIELEDMLSEELQLRGLSDDGVNEYGEKIEEIIDIVVEM